jgi:uracil phosphoribosyltransferase
MLDHLTVVSHPLVQHKLTLMREKDTSTASFRKLLREISLLLAYEVTRELPMTTKRIETPLEEMDAPVIEGKKLALVSILRAGNGLLPDHMEDRIAIVVDPMLATGNSSVAALDLLKKAGAREIRFLCLLAAPEGIARMKEAHPDVPIVTAAVDSHLNDHGYIVPGLGDAGDRMFGTK